MLIPVSNAVLKPPLQTIPSPVPPAASAPTLRDIFATGGQPIRLDIPHDVYHADRSCVSSTGLKKMLRSPAHYRAYLDNGVQEETPALFMGTAIHCRLLEPQEYQTQYVVTPDIDKRTSAWKAFVLANPGKRLLTPDQAAIIEGIAASVDTHPTASSLLKAGFKEASLIWQDADTGIWVKIRPDCLLLDLGTGICLDIKSTEDASADAFSRACLRYDYDLSAALYLDGLRAIFNRDFDFCFLPVEKSAPFGRALYGAPDEMIQRGRRRYRYALEQIAECQLRGEWPNYQPDGGYEVLDWPRWAM